MKQRLLQMELDNKEVVEKRRFVFYSTANISTLFPSCRLIKDDHYVVKPSSMNKFVRRLHSAGYQIKLIRDEVRNLPWIPWSELLHKSDSVVVPVEYPMNFFSQLNLRNKSWEQVPIFNDQLILQYPVLVIGSNKSIKNENVRNFLMSKHAKLYSVEIMNGRPIAKLLDTVMYSQYINQGVGMYINKSQLYYCCDGNVIVAMKGDYFFPFEHEKFLDKFSLFDDDRVWIWSIFDWLFIEKILRDAKVYLSPIKDDFAEKSRDYLDYFDVAKKYIKTIYN